MPSKAEVGYTTSPILPVCGACAHFTSELVLPRWMELNNQYSDKIKQPRGYSVEDNGIEKNLRCKLHGFAVKKMSNCYDWSAKK